MDSISAVSYTHLLFEAEKEDDTDAKAAQAVTDMIDALGEITLEKEADVAAARAAYDLSLIHILG